MKKLLVIFLLVVAAAGAWVLSQRNSAPELAFTKVKHETIVDTLSTNGKVEPLEYASVRAEREGTVLRVAVEKGQRVTRGTVMIEFDARDSQADLATAQSRIQQAKVERDLLDSGGRASDLTEIENSLTRAQSDLKIAQTNLATLQRLQGKGAATRQEVVDAQESVDRAELQIEALNKRRQSLVTVPDKKLADAKIHDGEIAAANAQRQLDLSVVHSPLDGTVYQIDLKPGAFLNPGDLIATVGRLDRVRAVIYVDEPELGRVRVGMPVAITWDAQPGRKWQGTVDKVPTQIVALGTRQVGEVSSVVENTDGELLPGTNITAEIRSKVVENVLAIPRDALRIENGEHGVYTLDHNNKLTWRKVETGVSSVTDTQVLRGLELGDSVARPTDRTLQTGMVVRPVYP